MVVQTPTCFSDKPLSGSVPELVACTTFCLSLDKL